MRRYALGPIALVATLTAVAMGGASWAQIAHSVTCKSTGAACLSGDNTAAGPGVSGSSTGIGVEGSSTKSNPAVLSSTTDADAVVGSSASGTGIAGSSKSSYGVFGTTTEPKAPAILADVTGKKPAYAVSGVAVGGAGIVGSGIIAFRGTASANCISLPSASCVTGGPAGDYLPVAALGLQTVGAQSPLVLRNAKNQIIFSVDYAGTVFFAGQLSCPNISNEIVDTTQGLDFWMCPGADIIPLVRGRDGKALEFEGEGSLVAGSARVILPPDFTAQMSPTQGYHVFLTPLGDTRTPLSVPVKTAQGFVVTAPGGRTSFEYRIVAARAETPTSSLQSQSRTVGQAPTLGNAFPETTANLPVPAPAEQAVPLVAPTPCKSTSACLESTNTGTGTAVEGESKSGYGVVGKTTGAAGIGIEGSALLAAGVSGSATKGRGLSATSSSGTALVGTTASNAAAGVLGQTTESAGIGVSAESASGTGVFGSGVESFSGIGGITITGTQGAPLAIIRNTASKRDIFSVDDFGTLGFHGAFNCPAAYISVKDTGLGLYGTTCKETNVINPAGKARFERVGEAKLIDGFASVALPRSIVRRLDRSLPYTATVTPEGDSTGWLYVASRTPSGFTVREHGGRSSILFEYDIEGSALEDTR